MFLYYYFHYKKITFVQNSEHKHKKLHSTKNNVDNIITGTIEVNQPNQRVKFVANTGPTNFADFGGVFS